MQILFPKGLDSSRQNNILRKTTNSLSLQQDMLRQFLCHLPLILNTKCYKLNL